MLIVVKIQGKLIKECKLVDKRFCGGQNQIDCWQAFVGSNVCNVAELARNV